MEYKVHIQKEPRRLAGYRKPGRRDVGIYLMGALPPFDCPRLPYRLEPCPTCKVGYKFGRSWTWIDPTRLFSTPKGNTVCPPKYYNFCPICNPERVANHQAGLLWVGRKWYSPESFIEETRRIGISKRVPHVPYDVKLGKTWVYLAHPDAGGIICAFKPVRVDLVVEDHLKLPSPAKIIAQRFKNQAKIIKVIQD